MATQRKATVKVAPPAAADPVTIFADVEQSSPEWFELRRGLATASEFGTIIRDAEDSKTRRTLLYRLAGEVLTGASAETFTNKSMERGKEMEGRAREYYGFTRAAALAQVGFVRRELSPERFVGCSPDALVGNDGVLEIKTMIPEKLIDYLIRGTPPPEHRAQIQGSLWVTGRAWCDLLVYYDGMPLPGLWRFERDETYISGTLAPAVEIFQHDLKRLVEKLRGMAR